MRARLRRYFIAGLIVFLPIAITVSLVIWVLRIMDRFLGWLLPPVFGRAIPGLGLVLSLLVILAIGALATNVLGRRLVAVFDRLMLRIPLARSIYAATKAISDGILLQRRAAFRRAVLVEWPRRGMHTVGFVTSEGAVVAGDPGTRMVSVFVVTTPNPTTGFMMFVPESEARPLDMSVEDALKVVISAGIISPEVLPPVVRDPAAADEGRG